MRSSRVSSASAILLGVLFVAAACGSGSPSSSPSRAPSPSRLSSPSSGDLSVSDAWARPTVDASQPSAAYLTIANTSDQADTLLRVSSPAAATVEMHQTSMDESGMTGMQPMSQLDVAAGATVKLQPDGMHLMLTGLTGPLKVGDSVELDLFFQHAGKVVVSTAVRQG